MSCIKLSVKSNHTTLPQINYWSYLKLKKPNELLYSKSLVDGDYLI